MEQENLDVFRRQLIDNRTLILRRIGKISHHRLNDGGPLNPDSKEAAQELENDQVLDALDDSSRTELVQIQAALDRLEAGVYGECRECGDSVGLARLNALPYATLCIECARALES